jgi:hypothetical protein
LLYLPSWKQSMETQTALLETVKMHKNCLNTLNKIQLIAVFFVCVQYATHAIVFSQLLIDGRNEGIHAFICQLRDDKGNVCPGLRTADCGHKIGLNGIDNGCIWYAIFWS